MVNNNIVFILMEVQGKNDELDFVCFHFVFLFFRLDKIDWTKLVLPYNIFLTDNNLYY